MLPAKVEISAAAIFQPVEEEGVVLNMDTHEYYGLNETGSRMWQLLLKLGDTEQVVSELTTIYAVDPVQARTDLDDLVSRLLDVGLLRVP